MEQNYISAEQARELTEKRIIELREERKENIMAAIVNNATRYGQWHVAVSTEKYWDDYLYNFFSGLGYYVEIHPELIVIMWDEKLSI